MTACTERSFGINSENKFAQLILIVLYACLIKKTTAEDLPFDDTFVDGKGKLEDNTTYSTQIAGRLAGSLYGNFAPNKSQLWLDEYGNPEMQYYVDTNSTRGYAFTTVTDLLTLATSQWSQYTCLKFKTVDGEQCSRPESLTHGILHVGTFLYKCCSSLFGNQFPNQGGSKSCQKMCVDYRFERCNLLDVRDMISYTLGLLSPMNRPDRDDYVTVNPEQMDLEMWPPVPYNHIQRWRSMSKCPQSQGSGTTPVPFDYLSSKNPLTSQNVDGHAEFAIVVARDRRKQYLFDHRQSSCPDLSHLDIYQVNKGYGCDKRYAEECLKSQGAAPKCLNFGYLKKDCTCACSKYFTGPRCETATNAADSCIKNAWFMEITNVTNTSVYDTVDVGMSVPKEKLFEGYLFNKIYSEFQDGYQYLTITIEPANLLNHISVTLNFTKMQKVLDRMLNDPHEHDTGQVVIADSPFLHRNFTPPDKLMTQLMGFECGKVVEGFAMLWGAESQNQLRIWCFSSFFLNETQPAMLRSRKAGTFHMVARSGLGAFFRGEPHFSVESLLIRMEVSSFGVPPDDSLSPTNGTDAGGSRSGGGGEESILQHWAEALLSDASPTGLIGAGVVGVILLAGIGVVGFCGRYCHAEEGDEDGVSLDRFGENSGDDADDWDSD